MSQVYEKRESEDLISVEKSIIEKLPALEICIIEREDKKKQVKLQSNIRKLSKRVINSLSNAKSIEELLYIDKLKWQVPFIGRYLVV